MPRILKGQLRAAYQAACRAPGSWILVEPGLEVRAERSYPTPGSNPRFAWKWIYSARIAGTDHGWGPGLASAVGFTLDQLRRLEAPAVTP